MKKGWICLWRKLREKGYYKNSKYVHLWVHLLLSANKEPREFMWNQEIIHIKEGQLITGRKQLAKETGIKQSTIEDILKVLENEHQIRQQKTTKFRLITVINWRKYQDKPTAFPTTEQQQSDTNNNNNNNNKEYICSFDTFWKEYPKRVSKANSLKAWIKLKPTADLVEKILADVKVKKKSDQWLRDNGQFIPHPSTYLNQKRWEDEVERPITEEEKIWGKK